MGVVKVFGKIKTLKHLSKLFISAVFLFFIITRMCTMYRADNTKKQDLLRVIIVSFFFLFRFNDKEKTSEFRFIILC